jgi:hypothetical protein
MSLHGELVFLTAGAVVKGGWGLRKVLSKHFGSDAYRTLQEKEKVCFVLPSKSGKSYLVNHLDDTKYLSLDLDDLSSFVKKEEVEKLEELKTSNLSLYNLLYKDVVKNALEDIKKQIKQSKKKLLCVCKSHDLASYLFKASSVYVGIPSKSFRVKIRQGLNTEKDRDVFNSSVEEILQHIHKNRPVLVFNSYEELNKQVIELLGIQNKI